MAAVKKRFAPEFVNRVDSVITYQPLSQPVLDQILSLQLTEMQRHILRRLGARAFQFEMTRAGRQFLIEKGSSEEFGARELKRTLHRMLFHPLAAMMVDGEIPPRATVRIDAGKDRAGLKFRVRRPMLQVLRPTG